MFLTEPGAALALRAATQHVWGFDAYDLAPALLALGSGLALALRSVLRPGGIRSLAERPLDQTLVWLVALGIGMLALHEIVTDGLCHGACAFPSAGTQ